jgi:hypothetical protein
MPIIPALKKTVIVGHRWMGTTLCLLFPLWFASGIGMMYWTYPSVSDEDRLRHDPPLEPGKLTSRRRKPPRRKERKKCSGPSRGAPMRVRFSLAVSTVSSFVPV